MLVTAGQSRTASAQAIRLFSKRSSQIHFPMGLMMNLMETSKAPSQTDYPSRVSMPQLLDPSSSQHTNSREIRTPVAVFSPSGIFLRIKLTAYPK